MIGEKRRGGRPIVSRHILWGLKPGGHCEATEMGCRKYELVLVHPLFGQGSSLSERSCGNSYRVATGTEWLCVWFVNTHTRSPYPRRESVHLPGYCERLLFLPLSFSDAPGKTAVTETRVIARDNVLIPTLTLPHTPVKRHAHSCSLDSTTAFLRWDSLALFPRSDVSAIRKRT